MKITEPSPIPPELKSLAALLKKRQNLVTELGRLDILGPQFEIEEKEFLASANFEDRQQLDCLAQIRVKRELVPVKKSQLEEAITLLDERIAAEHRERFVDYCRLTRPVAHSAKSKVLVYLEKVTGGKNLILEQALSSFRVLEPFYTCEVAVTASDTSMFGPVKAAERLIQAWQQFIAAPPTLPALFDQTV